MKFNRCFKVQPQVSVIFLKELWFSSVFTISLQTTLRGAYSTVVTKDSLTYDFVDKINQQLQLV